LGDLRTRCGFTLEGDRGMKSPAVCRAGQVSGRERTPKGRIAAEGLSRLAPRSDFDFSMGVFKNEKAPRECNRWPMVGERTGGAKSAARRRSSVAGHRRIGERNVSAAPHSSLAQSPPACFCRRPCSRHAAAGVTEAEATEAEVTAAGAAAGAPCMSAVVECVWAEAVCASAAVPACALSAADVAFGTAVGTPTVSARAGSSPLAAMSGFAVKDRSAAVAR
jgi:hypothetical protein